MMRVLRVLTVVVAVSVAMSAACCVAQVAGSPKPAAPKPLTASIAGHTDWPVAKAEDVQSVEVLVAALYDVISGPAGKPRDWNRFKSLFLPDGRLGIVRPAQEATKELPARAGDVFFLTPDGYVERDDPYFKAHGFFERAITTRVEEFGNLVSVWSAYESRNATADEKPFARGINSIQIAHAQGRFWIASIIWDDERPGLVLPEKYLKP